MYEACQAQEFATSTEELVISLRVHLWTGNNTNSCCQFVHLLGRRSKEYALIAAMKVLHYACLSLSTKPMNNQKFTTYWNFLPRGKSNLRAGCLAASCFLFVGEADLIPWSTPLKTNLNTLEAIFDTGKHYLTTGKDLEVFESATTQKQRKLLLRVLVQIPSKTTVSQPCLKFSYCCRAIVVEGTCHHIYAPLISSQTLPLAAGPKPWADWSQVTMKSTTSPATLPPLVSLWDYHEL